MELSPTVEIHYFLLNHVLSWKSGSTFHQIHWATNFNIEQTMQPPSILSLDKGNGGSFFGQLEFTREEKKMIQTTLDSSHELLCACFSDCILIPFRGSPIFMTQYPKIRPYCFLDFAMEGQYKASFSRLQLICLSLIHLLYLFIQPATQLLKMIGM